jgi:hypothetical protein
LGWTAANASLALHDRWAEYVIGFWCMIFVLGAGSNPKGMLHMINHTAGAQGGAAAVVGLDGSERIAGFARQVKILHHVQRCCPPVVSQGAWPLKRLPHTTKPCYVQLGVFACERVRLSGWRGRGLLRAPPLFICKHALINTPGLVCPGPCMFLLLVSQIVSANKLDAGSGGPINIVSGRVEEVNDIGHEKVCPPHCKPNCCAVCWLAVPVLCIQASRLCAGELFYHCQRCCRTAEWFCTALVHRHFFLL